MQLTDQQRFDWLRLLRTEGVGPKTFLGLVNRYGGAGEALRALPALSRQRNGKPAEIPAEDVIAREMETARRFGARFIARGETEYPRALAVIDTAPPLMAIIGTLDISSVPLVSIVGSRNASLAGLKLAERIASDLGQQGYGIVSGLARGIDTRAHHASLKHGAVAVVAGGLDRLYPEENRGLFDRLCAEGAVLSEMPFGWEPRGRDFPRRNRIVSGLSLGTVIVEAARKSGSLITAKFALEQGREVFAVPGSPLDPRSEGPNDLIRQGATLTRDARDILETVDVLRGKEFEQREMFESGGERRDAPLWDETDWLEQGIEAEKGPADPPYDGWEEAAGQNSRERVLALLTSAPAEPDDIARAANVSIRELNLLLFELETEGRLSRAPGGRISVVAL
ncbi:MAG: DNA-processing protein DprA [Beijerinckiaceae bacterium]